MARSAGLDATARATHVAVTVDAGVRVPRPGWLTAYTTVLVVLDAAAMTLATLTANAAWLGINPGELHIRSITVPYAALALVTVPTWLAILALVGAYDLGPFGTSDRRVWARIVRAAAQLLAVVAMSYYVLHLAMLGRGVLVALIPLGVLMTLAGRAGAALGLHLARRHGRARRTALVLGTARAVQALVDRIERSGVAAVTVVGVAVVDQPGHHGSGHGHGGNGADVDIDRKGASAGTDQDGFGARSGNGNGVDVDGNGNRSGNGQGEAPAGQPDPRMVTAALARTGAETVIITGELAQGRLRDIAWTLEGTGVDLLVTPTAGGVERLSHTGRPVTGLRRLAGDG